MSDTVKDILNELDLPALLTDCPLAILIEHQGIAVWSNPRFIALLEMEQLDNQDSRVAALLTAGETIELSNGQGQSHYLTHHIQSGDNQALPVVHYYADQTALFTLQQQANALQTEVDNTRLVEPSTGLLTRRAMLLSLDPLVSRSRRYNNSLSIAQMTVDLEQDSNTEEAVRSISQLLKDQLRWADLIGHFEENSFVMVLPETGQDDAQKLAGKVCEKLTHLTGIEASYFGIAEWCKGDNAASLLQRSAEAMQRAQRDKQDCAVAS